MLCSVTAKLPRSGVAAIGTQWCTYRSPAAAYGSSVGSESKQRGSRHRNLGDSSIKCGIICRNIALNHGGHLNFIDRVDQQYNFNRITQLNRYTSTTTQTQAPDDDGQTKSNPSPHFKTRKNLEGKSEKVSADKVSSGTREAEKPGSHHYLMPHPIWTDEELDAVEITHNPPQGKVDKAAYFTCKMMRANFDFFSGFTWGKRTERKWIYRIIFLETVAGVPGMVAAMTRHLRSLRRMQRDHGWIHTLLEEAENERMHLMTALEIKQPSLFFRLMVLGAQGIFVNVFFISYLISPRFCHRFVGYLEEEAVITYTKLLKDLREDALPKWKDKVAPEIAINYWKLRPNADYIDLFRAIRADEAHHREVNHTLSDINTDDRNPYGPGQ